MNYFKEITLSTCSAILLFGMIKSILPSKFYLKYMRLLLIMIFIVLIAKAVNGVSIKDSLNFDNIKIEQKNQNVEKQLSLQIKIYINDQLHKKKYETTCSNVTVIKELEDYYILDITIKSNIDEKSNVVKYLMEITGLKEGQIYVEP